MKRISAELSDGKPYFREQSAFTWTRTLLTRLTSKLKPMMSAESLKVVFLKSERRKGLKQPEEDLGATEIKGDSRQFKST